MTIKELLKAVSTLVSEREIINHGSIRCLWSEADVRSIESAEPCDDVGTGTVGDDALADKLSDLIENDQEGGIDFEVLKNLEYAFKGEDITDYLTEEKEDELILLEKLIDAAREI